MLLSLKLQVFNMKSGFLKLSVKDFIKGLVVAILTAIGTYLSSELTGDADVTIKKIGIASFIALIAYLVKNFFTNNKDQLLTSDKP